MPATIDLSFQDYLKRRLVGRFGCNIPVADLCRFLRANQLPPITSRRHLLAYLQEQPFLHPDTRRAGYEVWINYRAWRCRMQKAIARKLKP